MANWRDSWGLFDIQFFFVSVDSIDGRAEVIS